MNLAGICGKTQYNQRIQDTHFSHNSDLISSKAIIGIFKSLEDSITLVVTKETKFGGKQVQAVAI